MVITIELPPELEAQLRASAARGDVEVVRHLLLQAITPTVQSLLTEAPEELTDAEFESLADELADGIARSLGTNPPVLSDYAVSREGIYEGHP